MLKFNNVDSLKDYLKNNLLTSIEVANLLGCTRQHVSLLVKTGQLSPVLTNEKLNIFLKQDIKNYLEFKKN